MLSFNWVEGTGQESRRGLLNRRLSEWGSKLLDWHMSLGPLNIVWGRQVLETVLLFKINSPLRWIAI